MSALAFLSVGRIAGCGFGEQVLRYRFSAPLLPVGTIGLSRLFPASPVCGSVIVQPPFGNEIAPSRFSIRTAKSDGSQRFFAYSFFVSRNFFYFCAFIGISEIPFRVTEKKQTNYNKLIYTQCKVKA
jgi:hypothetical protein